jgi:hypothetical protein
LGSASIFALLRCRGTGRRARSSGRDNQVAVANAISVLFTPVSGRASARTFAVLVWRAGQDMTLLDK